MIGGPTVIQLHRGSGLDLLAPDPAAITIADIARGLATEARFAGQTAGPPYSVAEHSVHVSRIVPSELALVALLHDAHEAYIGDLSAPLKLALAALAGIDAVREIEHRLDRAIGQRFGVALRPMHPAVKAADLALLAAERDEVMGGERGVRWQVLPAPAVVVIECWGWERAEREFLRRFGELAEGRL